MRHMQAGAARAPPSDSFYHPLHGNAVPMSYPAAHKELYERFFPLDVSKSCEFAEEVSDEKPSDEKPSEGTVPAVAFSRLQALFTDCPPFKRAVEEVMKAPEVLAIPRITVVPLGSEPMSPEARVPVSIIVFDPSMDVGYQLSRCPLCSLHRGDAAAAVPLKADATVLKHVINWRDWSVRFVQHLDQPLFLISRVWECDATRVAWSSGAGTRPVTDRHPHRVSSVHDDVLKQLHDLDSAPYIILRSIVAIPLFQRTAVSVQLVTKVIEDCSEGGMTIMQATRQLNLQRFHHLESILNDLLPHTRPSQGAPPPLKMPRQTALQLTSAGGSNPESLGDARAAVRNKRVWNLMRIAAERLALRLPSSFIRKILFHMVPMRHMSCAMEAIGGIHLRTDSVLKRMCRMRMNGVRFAAGELNVLNELGLVIAWRVFRNETDLDPSITTLRERLSSQANVVITNWYADRMDRLVRLRHTVAPYALCQLDLWHEREVQATAIPSLMSQKDREIWRRLMSAALFTTSPRVPVHGRFWEDESSRTNDPATMLSKWLDLAREFSASAASSPAASATSAMPVMTELLCRRMAIVAKHCLRDAYLADVRSSQTQEIESLHSRISAGRRRVQRFPTMYVHGHLVRHLWNLNKIQRMLHSATQLVAAEHLDAVVPPAWRAILCARPSALAADVLRGTYSGPDCGLLGVCATPVVAPQVVEEFGALPSDEDESDGESLHGADAPRDTEADHWQEDADEPDDEDGDAAAPVPPQSGRTDCPNVQRCRLVQTRLQAAVRGLPTAPDTLCALLWLDSDDLSTRNSGMFDTYIPACAVTTSVTAAAAAPLTPVGTTGMAFEDAIGANLLPHVPPPSLCKWAFGVAGRLVKAHERRQRLSPTLHAALGRQLGQRATGPFRSLLPDWWVPWLFRRPLHIVELDGATTIQDGSKLPGGKPLESPSLQAEIAQIRTRVPIVVQRVRDGGFLPLLRVSEGRTTVIKAVRLAEVLPSDVPLRVPRSLLPRPPRASSVAAAERRPRFYTFENHEKTPTFRPGSEGGEWSPLEWRILARTSLEVLATGAISMGKRGARGKGYYERIQAQFGAVVDRLKKSLGQSGPSQWFPTSEPRTHKAIQNAVYRMGWHKKKWLTFANVLKDALHTPTKDRPWPDAAFDALSETWSALVAEVAKWEGDQVVAPEAFRARVRDLLLPVTTSSAVAGGQGAGAASSGESAKAAFMADVSALYDRTIAKA